MSAHVRRELAPPSRPLGYGSSGRDVRRVQEWLCHHGQATACDGAYGPATARAVRAAQHVFGLRPTGRVGPATWARLVEPLRAATSPAQCDARSYPEAVIALAERHLEHRPHEIGGPNCGPWVRLYCGGHDGAPWAWCAGFVSHVLHQAAAERGERAPVAGSVSCDTLAAQAKAAGRFVSARAYASSAAARRRVAAGAVFLARRTATDWTHTGFVLDVDARTFATIEGNTNAIGSRDGFETCRRTRAVSPRYDFIVLDAPPADEGRS